MENTYIVYLVVKHADLAGDQSEHLIRILLAS